MTQGIGLATFAFVLLLGLSSPLTAHAQQPAKVARIGYLSLESLPPLYLQAFRDGLRRLGYVEGRDIALEIRLAEWNAERLPGLASELVALKVEAIVAADGASVRTLSRATTTIPIVMGLSADPVEAGLVTSFARPGGNLTGMTFLQPEIAGKRLQFLREVAPTASRVAVLTNPIHPGEEQEWRAMEAAAKSLSMTLHFLPVPEGNDLADVFAAITRERAEAIVTIPGPMTRRNRKQIADFALKTRLPTIAGWAEYADVGSLISYGPNRRDAVRRLAYFVDKIVKGAKPAELPVERPTRFELAINLKTAKALGLTIPSSLLLQADQVIE